MTALTRTDFWEIISGSKYCQLVDDGRCVTDGAGKYGPNEDCVVKAVRPLILSTTQYAVEEGSDHIKVGGKTFRGTGLDRAPQKWEMEKGEELKWHSDRSVQGQGFKVCAASTGMLVDLFGWLGYIDRCIHWID